MKLNNLQKVMFLTFIIILMNRITFAQTNTDYIRFTKITINSANLENYKTVLK